MQEAITAEKTKLVRIIHSRLYDSKRGRFTSDCFKNSTSDRGISVVDIQCVQQIYNTSICTHVKAFYSKITGIPIVLWYLDAEIYSKEIDIEIKPSNTGDKCHRNIKKLSRGQAKKFVREYCKQESLSICLEQKEIAFDNSLLASDF